MLIMIASSNRMKIQRLEAIMPMKIPAKMIAPARDADRPPSKDARPEIIAAGFKTRVATLKIMSGIGSHQSLLVEIASMEREVKKMNAFKSRTFTRMKRTAMEVPRSFFIN